MDGVTLVREYYRSVDEDEYAALTDVLASGFVHRRPDRTIEGREEFIAFMRGSRPERDTEHELEAIYTERDGGRIAAEGQLRHADGSEWFGFVDSFRIRRGKIRSIRTYTDASPA
ncbi:nuclear transport factor 2 family protein [Natronomonas sp. F2-12]|jgi:ketosteroid isomerase-like protein|uniref:Nuclear transport factor 2 family protein n=1 Tax=Natronomonas aquatica TaxID=2841590 RepID=A0A9R1CRS1_9EURY|nr:nuclear transport factor 2 family protein [Natronomonas aquatica]MCQ4334043.1 nuclear transport factor 2 family protein [Natronomonas aquatica]